MKDDPIVEETRAARAKLFAQAGNDLDRLMELLREGELEHKGRVVTLEDVRRMRRERSARSGATRDAG